mgnify:FL=1
MALQIAGCGASQFRLFSPADRFFGSARLAVTTLLDFYKNERLAIDHDQVDFTRSTAIVSQQQYQALPLQEFSGNILRPVMTSRWSALDVAIVQSLIHLPGLGCTLGGVRIALSQPQCLVSKSRSRHRISIPDTL